MDKFIRRINTSPKTRRKLSSCSSNFGIPLKDLVGRDSIDDVPRMVVNICEYLLINGFKTEGIFRINGSAKLIDSLKRAFEVTSASNLYSVENIDVYALAGVLKLFFRELPDGVVPEKFALKFIKVAKDSTDPSICVAKIQSILATLPYENYQLLKYLCHFLFRIAANERENKMSSTSLGIIFGPSIFRCSLDSHGLRNQGFSNHVLTLLIQNYPNIFDNIFENKSCVQTAQANIQTSTSPVPLSEFTLSTEYPPNPVGSNFDNRNDTANFNHFNSYRMDLDDSIWSKEDEKSPEPGLQRIGARRNYRRDSTSTIGSSSITPTSPLNSLVAPQPSTLLSSVGTAESMCVCRSVDSTTKNCRNAESLEVDLRHQVDHDSMPREMSTLPTDSSSFHEHDYSDDSLLNLNFDSSSDQLARDLVNIIRSIATSGSLEALTAQPLSDDPVSALIQVSNNNESLQPQKSYIEHELKDEPTSEREEDQEIYQTEETGEINYNQTPTFHYPLSNQRAYYNQCARNRSGSSTYYANAFDEAQFYELLNTRPRTILATAYGRPVKCSTSNCPTIRSSNAKNRSQSLPNSSRHYLTEGREKIYIATRKRAISTNTQPNESTNAFRIGRSMTIPTSEPTNSDISTRHKEQPKPSPHFPFNHSTTCIISENQQSTCESTQADDNDSSANIPPNLTQAIHTCLDNHVFVPVDEQSQTVDPNQLSTLPSPTHPPVSDFPPEPCQNLNDQTFVPQTNATLNLQYPTHSSLMKPTIASYCRSLSEQCLRQLSLNQTLNSPANSAENPHNSEVKPHCDSPAICTDGSVNLLPGPNNGPNHTELIVLPDPSQLPCPDVIHEAVSSDKIQTSKDRSQSLHVHIHLHSAEDTMARSTPCLAVSSPCSTHVTRPSSEQRKPVDTQRQCHTVKGDNQLRPQFRLQKTPQQVPVLSKANASDRLSRKSGQFDQQKRRINKSLSASRANRSPKVRIQQTMPRFRSSTLLTPSAGIGLFQSPERRSQMAKGTKKTVPVFLKKFESDQQHQQSLHARKSSPLHYIEPSRIRCERKMSDPPGGTCVGIPREKLLRKSQSSNWITPTRRSESVGSERRKQLNIRVTPGCKSTSPNSIPKSADPSSAQSLESFYELLCAVLMEQRKCCGRPEALSDMNWDQVEQEKLDLQKGLLYYENLYGRPKEPNAKRIMKPLYERYRLVKRLVQARHGRKENDGEQPYACENLSSVNPIQPDKNSISSLAIPSHLMHSSKQSKILTSNDLMQILGTPLRSPEAVLLDEPDKTDDAILSGSTTHLECMEPKKDMEDSVETEPNLCDAFPRNQPQFVYPCSQDYIMHLQTLSRDQLLEEKRSVLTSKRALQHTLRSFEKEIEKTENRKPTRSERQQLREKYETYRILKRQLHNIDSVMDNLIDSSLTVTSPNCSDLDHERTLSASLPRINNNSNYDENPENDPKRNYSQSNQPLSMLYSNLKNSLDFNNSL